MDKDTQKEIFEIGVAIKNLILLDEVIERHEAKIEAMLITRDKLREKIGVKLFASVEYRALELQKGEPIPEPEIYFDLDHYFVTGKTEDYISEDFL